MGAGFRRLRPGEMGGESEIDIYRKRSRQKTQELEGPGPEEVERKWGVKGSGKAVRMPRWSVPGGDKSKQMLQRRPRRDYEEENL